MRRKSRMANRLLPALALSTALVSVSAVAAAAAAAAAQPATVEHQETARPNILVILVDDLDWADVSTYGLNRVETPNIDRIAKEGVAFTNGYVAASVCAPSRAALMTGRYQQRYGFEYNMSDKANIDDGLPLNQKTMGDRLSAAGYYTGVIGKWDLG